MNRDLKNKIKSVFYNIGLSKLLFPIKKTPSYIKNVFGSNASKKVLLSYITSAFNQDTEINKQHTNSYTTFVLAKVLDELGYVVDVVNWTEKFKGNFNEYEAVFGLGESLEEALLVKNPLTKIIFFATGSNPFYSNQATMKRVIDFYKKHGKYLMESSRFIYKDWPLQHQAADWIILHGNKFAESTYRNENISKVNAPVFVKEIHKISEPDWNIKRKHYLWFGSSGLIHKGLDLLLDTFKDIKDLDLHICGQIEIETRFYDYYKSLLSSSQNIHYHGCVNIDSDIFDKIMDKCGFVIFPSASEGGAAAVITCMANGGLIPIVTNSTDVDISNYGIEIKDLNIDAVTDAVKISQQLTSEELNKQRNEILNYTKKYHTFDYFKLEIKQQLSNILN